MQGKNKTQFWYFPNQISFKKTPLAHLYPNHPNTTTYYAFTKAVGAVRFNLTAGTYAMCGAESPPLKSFSYCLSQSDCGGCHASDIK
jgi:hypothetical protein